MQASSPGPGAKVGAALKEPRPHGRPRALLMAVSPLRAQAGPCCTLASPRDLPRVLLTKPGSKAPLVPASKQQWRGSHQGGTDSSAVGPTALPTSLPWEQPGARLGQNSLLGKPFLGLELREPPASCPCVPSPTQIPPLGSDNTLQPPGCGGAPTEQRAGSRVQNWNTGPGTHRVDDASPDTQSKHLLSLKVILKPLDLSNLACEPEVKRRLSPQAFG